MVVPMLSNLNVTVLPKVEISQPTEYRAGKGERRILDPKTLQQQTSDCSP
jgi:hypothetical protein